MPRPRKSVPAYALHKPSGQARVRVNLPGGGRKTIYLGKYDSPESRAEYARVVASLKSPAAAAPASRRDDPDGTPDVTLNELMLAFLEFARTHYRQPDGTPTSELYNYKLSLRPVKELFGGLLARRFGPRELKLVRDYMVAAGWCRRQINGRVNRIRRVVKWGVSENLLPVEVHQRLSTVTGLQRGRSGARESDPVLPVAVERVDAVLPHLLPAVRGMIEVQLLTGMRPGEVCRMRPCDVEVDGDLWAYRPDRHKTAYRGKARVVFLGPKARSVLEAFAPADPMEAYFSPRRAVERMRAERAATRKTPRTPSQQKRQRVAAPKRKPAAVYAVSSYAHAVAKACDRAFPPPPPLARRDGETKAAWLARLTAAERAELAAWRAAHRWHPNQLRHTFATDVRRDHGIEAAQVLLGHAKADVTQVYAERDFALARRVAAEVG